MKFFVISFSPGELSHGIIDHEYGRVYVLTLFITGSLFAVLIPIHQLYPLYFILSVINYYLNWKKNTPLLLIEYIALLVCILDIQSDYENDKA